MPDTGAPFYLPYPDLAEDADAPYWIQNLAAAEHNALASKNPRSSRQKTTSQAMPTASTSYTILWDIDDYDTSTDTQIPYDVATGIWTIDRAGTYLINTAIHFQWSSGTNTLQPNLGVTPFGGSQLVISYSYVCATINSSVSFSRAFRCGVGDTIKIMGRSNIANTTIYGAATRYTIANITWIGG